MIRNYVFRCLPLLTLLIITFSNLLAQTEEVRTDADWMPYFAGCDKGYRERSNEKRACSDANLTYYLTQKLIFPDSARVKGINGTVYVTFIVRSDGRVDNVKLLNDIGGGCGIIARQVVEQMPDWEPAVHKDKRVSVQLKLPIKFEIDEGSQAQKNCKIYWNDLRTDVINITQLREYAENKVLVRDNKGELYPVLQITLTYENGKKFKQKSCKGERLNDELKKMLRKVKPGGTLTITTTLQKKGTFFELHRSFSLIP
jgi:TonB family protein